MINNTLFPFSDPSELTKEPKKKETKESHLSLEKTIEQIIERKIKEMKRRGQI